MVFAGTPRMHASTSDADEQPAAATNDWWVVSRADNKGKRPAGTGPLSSAATENSPCADGTDNRVSTSHPPGRVPEKHRMLGVTSKRRDIALYPLQSRHLIGQSVMARRSTAFHREQRVRKETQHSQPRLNGHHDHSLLWQRRQVDRSRLRIALRIAARVKKNHYGLLLAGRVL